MFNDWNELFFASSVGMRIIGQNVTTVIAAKPYIMTSLHIYPVVRGRNSLAIQCHYDGIIDQGYSDAMRKLQSP